MSDDSRQSQNETAGRGLGHWLGQFLERLGLRAGGTAREEIVEALAEENGELADLSVQERAMLSNVLSLRERRVGRDGDDVGARNHHVVDTTLAQAQHIGEHRAFLGGEIGEFAILLGQRLDDFLAGGAAPAQSEAVEELAEPVAEATAGGFVVGLSTVVAHDHGGLCGRRSGR